MIDISLTGCCVRTPLPFTAGALETVKVSFPIFEMVLSIWGATQWVRGEHLVGIHFRHPDAHSKNQLAGLLTCLIDNSAADVVKKAMAEIVANPSEDLIIQFEHPPSPAFMADSDRDPEPEPEPVEGVSEFTEPQIEAPITPPRPTLKTTDKILSMDAGQSPASLTMPGDDSVLGGDIVDVSSTGCLMRLFRIFTVRLQAQAEVSFHIQGLPFRLACITEEMHDKRTLELRFTQMSRRSREDLSQVITELIERSNREKKPS
jgi:hypothetical protein